IFADRKTGRTGFTLPFRFWPTATWRHRPPCSVPHVFDRQPCRRDGEGDAEPVSAASRRTRDMAATARAAPCLVRRGAAFPADRAADGLIGVSRPVVGQSGHWLAASGGSARRS